MNRESLKLRELTTFYGAQDWLTNTERGQSYLYRVSVDIYNRVKQANDLRVKKYYDKLNELTDKKERDSLFEAYKIHLEIDRVLKELKLAIDTLNYSNMVILIDKIVSMSHHGGPLLEYSQEELGENDYFLDEKVFRNLSGLFYDPLYIKKRQFPLSDVVYSKWGNRFPELAEQSGALPEDAEGYNLRGRNWESYDDVDIRVQLENLSSIVRDILDIIKKYPEMKQSEYNRLSITKNWVHNRILNLLEQYSIDPGELLDLISSDVGRYGYLYIAFPEASYRIINAMLDGDDKALEILRNMQPVSLRPVLKDFNHFIEQSARYLDVSDVVRYIQVFDDLNEADVYGIGSFLYYHPELENLFRVRLDDYNWENVQETVNRMNNNNLKEACIRVSDILLRNSLLER